jgi:AcrR family transcriptional regulator
MPRSKAAPPSAPRRRHPPKGGYARGDETRAKIVAAALELFGDHGFDGASTRLLAERAGVSLPALQYYFDGKEGMYLACAEHIAGHIEGRIGPVRDRIAQTLATEKPSRQRLFAMLDQLLDNLVELMVGGHELEKWVLFMIREQAHPTKAFDIIYARVMRRVVTASTSLVGALVGRPANDPVVLVRTLALVGQVLFFRTGRESALRVLGWPDFNGDRLAFVKETIRMQTRAALGSAAILRRRRRA